MCRVLYYPQFQAPRKGGTTISNFFKEKKKEKRTQKNKLLVQQKSKYNNWDLGKLCVL